MASTLFPNFQSGWRAFRRRLSGFDLQLSRGSLIAPPWKADTWTAQQRTLLRILALASRDRLAYGPLVAQLARDHRWWYRWRLRKLAQRLQAGTSLPDALEQTPGVLSPEQTIAVRFGVESGTLSEVLTLLVEQGSEATGVMRNRLRHVGCYLVGFLLVAMLVITFLVLKILPNLEMIFADFGLSNSPMSEALIGFSGIASGYSWIAAVLFLFCAWAFYSETGWGYVHRVWLPRISRSAVRLRTAEVLSLLSVAQHAGRPLAGSISTLARYFYDARTRTRLLFARNEIEQGATAWHAMQQAGLLDPAELRALETAVDSPAQAWTLRQLSEVRRGRIAGQLDFYAELIQPIAVLILAAGVLAVSLGTIDPLFKLIRDLC